MEKLTLYVVGQFSGDSEQWNPYADYALVVASSPEQACSLVDLADPACEVLMEAPRVLCRIAAAAEGYGRLD